MDDEPRKRLCVSIPIETKEAIEGIARYDARSPASIMQKILKIAVRKAKK